MNNFGNLLNFNRNILNVNFLVTIAKSFIWLIKIRQQCESAEKGIKVNKNTYNDKNSSNNTIYNRILLRSTI